VTRYHRLDSLKQQKFIVSILEVGSPKSRYWQGHVPIKPVGESFLVFSWLLVVDGSLWHFWLAAA